MLQLLHWCPRTVGERLKTGLKSNKVSLAGFIWICQALETITHLWELVLPLSVQRVSARNN